MKKSLLSIAMVLIWGGIGAFKIVSNDMKMGLIYCAVALIFAVSLLFGKKAGK